MARGRRPRSETIRSTAARALLLVGGVLFLSGQAVLASAFFHGIEGATASIPAGPAWYYVYPIDVVGPGRLTVSFEDVAGSVVDVHVFGAREYLAYEFVGLGNGLFSGRASAGSFAVDLPGTGTYYLVFDHGEGFEGVIQDVRVSLRLLGVEPGFLRGGAVFAGVGIVAVGLGLRLRRPSPGTL